MKFLASWFCTDAQINEVINANKMESMDSDIDTSLINISTDTDTQTVDNNGEVEQFDGNGIRMVEKIRHRLRSELHTHGEITVRSFMRL